MAGGASGRHGPADGGQGILGLHTATLTQRLAAAFLEGGHAESHLALLRTACRLRRDQMVGAPHQHCPPLRFHIPAGGYYLWAALPPPILVGDLLPRAAEQGVVVRPGPQFAPDGGAEDHVRLCFAALEPRAIVEGIRRLGEAIERAREEAGAAARRSPVTAVSVV